MPQWPEKEACISCCRWTVADVAAYDQTGIKRYFAAYAKTDLKVLNASEAFPLLAMIPWALRPSLHAYCPLDRFHVLDTLTTTLPVVEIVYIE